MSKVGTWFRRLWQKPLEVTQDEQTPAEHPEPVVEERVSDEGRTSEPSSNLETPPLQARDPEAVEQEPPVEPTPSSVGASMAYGWITDIGRVRDHNEDSVFVFAAEQCSSVTVPPFGLFILADGMGGHQAGEVASALACQVVAAHLMEHIYLPLLFGDREMAADAETFEALLAETLTDAIQQANTEVYSSTPGSGTTLTCALAVGNTCLIGHVGDSRAYLGQDGAIRLLTNDHSMVKQLVDIGQLTPEAAANHPRRNILYRAVGQGGALPVDVQSLRLEPETQLLLCTDGLWGLVSDEELWRIVTSAPTAQMACASLLEAANAAGGNDNITAILVEFQRRSGCTQPPHED